jgi:sugar lactone lactonase YvrE
MGLRAVGGRSLDRYDAASMRPPTLPTVVAVTLLAGCGETILLPSDGGVAAPDTAPASVTVILATAQRTPHDVALDGAWVYYTSIGDRAVRRVPRRGGVSRTLVVDEHGPTNLAVDDRFVYFGDYGRGENLFVDGRVGRVAKDGSGTVLYLAEDVPTVGAVLLDGDYVYYASMGTTVSGVYQNDGALFRVRKDGSARAEALTARDQRVPVGLAVDEAWVYWASAYGGTLARCPKSGCNGPPELLYAGQNQPRSVAVDDAWLYWASPQATAVFRAAKGGAGAVVELAASRGLPDGLVVAGPDLFWVEPVAHAVVRMPKEGGARPVALAADLGLPVAVAVDGDDVVFADEERGTIVRLAR